MFAGFLLFSPVLCWADASETAREWSGLYLGANAGWAGAVVESQTTTRVNSAGYFNVQSDEDDVNEVGDYDVTSDNFTGGGQIGYNWQTGLCVFGVETDFDVLNMDSTKSRSKAYVSQPAGQLTISTTAKTDWLWTLRSRVGYAKDRWLFYGTGGMTLANLEADFNVSDNFASASEHQNISKIKAGWIVGGGIERSIDKNWSIRTEYLYADLGTLKGDTNDLTETIGGLAPTTLHHEAEFVMHLVRLSLNYTF